VRLIGEWKPRFRLYRGAGNNSEPLDHYFSSTIDVEDWIKEQQIAWRFGWAYGLNDKTTFIIKEMKVNVTLKKPTSHKATDEESELLYRKINTSMAVFTKKLSELFGVDLTFSKSSKQNSRNGQYMIYKWEADVPLKSLGLFGKCCTSFEVTVEVTGKSFIDELGKYPVHIQVSYAHGGLTNSGGSNGLNIDNPRWAWDVKKEEFVPLGG
jgi:hypothetical protein